MTAATQTEQESSVRLTRLGGEFHSPAVEAQFAGDRLGETLRHGRFLLIGAVAFNLLFYISDWRFAGTPHFTVAIAMRTVVVLLALAALAGLRFCNTPQRLYGLMTGWMLLNAGAVAVLVSTHSNIALFVVLMLPVIYYLVVPASFAGTVVAGVTASALLLIGYSFRGMSSHGLGLALAMTILNGALVMAITRSNRLQRLQWLAMRTQARITAELASSREMLRTMFAASPVPLVVTAGTGGAVLHINDSAVALIGAPREEIDSGTMTRFYANPLDQQRLGTLLDRDGKVSDFEMEVRTADGMTRIVLLKATRVETAEGQLNISGLIDISDRKAAERSLERLASTDPLTELPNRLSFLASARSEMKRATRSLRPLSLLMIDLDHFKTINDTYGHQVGDEVLRAFAGLCRGRLREHDVAGRLGGEEFGVLLPNADIDAACGIAEEIRAAIAALEIPGAPALRVSASIGVSPVSPDEDSLDPALARADAALYAAKGAGRNCVRAADSSAPRCTG
jgi:diguanylate cyclase (GGDEF)-like protein/PAS domain S-box-containing protein